MTGSIRSLLGSTAPEVAPRLLGWLLTHETETGAVTVQLTEVEAYAGELDPASHAFRGPTPRNQIMFGPAGRLYVYFSYGMHWCVNLVTGPDGQASAVLMRAGRVVEGVELARSRRGPRVLDRSLARGPACLAQALGITNAHHATDLLSGGSLRLTQPRSADLSARTALAVSVSDKSEEVGEVMAGPRVGVSQAADVPWRFWLSGDETVSAYKRSPRALPLHPTPQSGIRHTESNSPTEGYL